MHFTFLQIIPSLNTNMTWFFLRIYYIPFLLFFFNIKLNFLNMNIKFLFFYVSHSKKKYFQEMFQFFKHSYSKNKQVFQIVPVLENFKHKNNPKNIGPAVYLYL